ncbi:MAG: aspartate/glutamate racemase family protein, partial [Patescibacteria group bacterium]|nr:aspartate/glutamate racemase family protein [Patescibacteria group bacterium]
TIESLDLKSSKNKLIGIIGTKATISSNFYKKEIKKINPKTKVIQKPTPLLVPFIEEGEIKSKALELVLKDYLKIFIEKKVDKLILACTHYGAIEKNIKKIIGRKIKVISQGKIIAEKLSLYLKNHPEIEKKLSKNSKKEIYLTDNPGKNYFNLFLKDFKIKKINLTFNL